MKIDIHNYEAFFLDFVEGRLDDASTLEMLTFLRKHPHLKEELEGFSDVRIGADNITFPEKDLLLKLDFKGTKVNENNFSDYAIAHHEKILSAQESEKLFQYLDQNPVKKNEFQLFGKVYLKADPAVVFDGKPFLKKRIKGAVRTIILRWTAVAAGIVIAVSVFYKSPDQQNIPVNQNKNEVVVRKIEKPATEIANNDFPEKVPTLPSRVSESKTDQGTVEQIIITREENLVAMEPLKALSVDGNYHVERPELASTLTPSFAVVEPQELDALDYAGKIIREKVLKSSRENNSSGRISLWNLADITLKGYNRIAEKDIIIHRKMDEDGKITAIAIETENKKYGFESKN